MPSLGGATGWLNWRHSALPSCAYTSCDRRVGQRSGMRPEGLSRRERSTGLVELLGQPDEDPLRASDVTEPILILVLRQFTNQLGSVRAEPGERIVDVLHGEHDA